MGSDIEKFWMHVYQNLYVHVWLYIFNKKKKNAWL